MRRSYPEEAAAIFAGGVLGTLARAGIAEGLPGSAGGFPWATLIANLAGAFLLGLVVARRPRMRALVGTGLCGALTTFSALQLELFELLDRGRPGTAGLYVAGSVAGGLAAVRLGRSV